ncbi:hypothetical protein ACF7Y4_05500 [Vibrio diabolicus]|uniref:hypothetical protein n=1 Tax=Vibrio diabolicus TaxID=50719 RepID=UPI00373F8650
MNKSVVIKSYLFKLLLNFYFLILCLNFLIDRSETYKCNHVICRVCYAKLSKVSLCGYYGLLNLI